MQTGSAGLEICALREDANVILSREAAKCAKIIFSELLACSVPHCQNIMGTHPHPNPPLEGEAIFSLFPLQGGVFRPETKGGREGDGVRKCNAMLKCGKVELASLHSTSHRFEGTRP